MPLRCCKYISALAVIAASKNSITTESARSTEVSPGTLLPSKIEPPQR